MIELLMLGGGLVAVTLAADALVDGASGLARRWGMPELLVGMTVCAFGTSAPELFVNVFASFAHRDGLVLGNVLGSNLFNTLAVLGVASLVAPLPVQASTLRIEIPLTLLALLAFLWMSANGVIGRLDGLVLLAGFTVFLVTLVGLAGTGPEPDDTEGSSGIGRLLLSLVALLVASRIVVVGATGLATRLGLSDALIGATIVAAGTSLPELATSVVAARRGQADLAVGNVVGSNLFNLLFVLGVSALVHPCADATGTFAIQGLTLLAITAVLWMALLRSSAVTRAHGLVLCAGYTASAAVLAWAG